MALPAAHLPSAVRAELVALAELAGLIRSSLVPFWSHGPTAPSAALGVADDALVRIEGPQPVFAPTSYARARLLRQLHACGLLTECEFAAAQQLYGVAR